MRRRDRLFRLLVLGAVVEAAVAIPSIISMGPEDGTLLIALLNAVLCFPYSFILVFTTPETQTASVLLLAIFQFPAYALLGWLLKRIRPRWNGWIVPAVIHVVAVAAVFGVLASKFQT